MSLCINDDLIWVAIPRCASYSIQTGLLNSDLNIKLYSEYERDFNLLDANNMHAHFKVNVLKNEFGNKETFCIKRDWFERWLSSFELVIDYIHKVGYRTTVPIEDIDNNYIYKVINREFVDLLYGNTIKVFDKLSNDTFDTEKYNDGMFRIMLSQNYWKLNKPCTYEFDIKEINKLMIFINNRYNANITIPKLNSVPKKMKNIVIDDKLKNWIWDLFEKKYTINGVI
jgi:hypothetical protein